MADQVPLDRQGLAFGIKQSAIPAAMLVSGLALPLLALPLGWRADVRDLRWRRAGGGRGGRAGRRQLRAAARARAPRRAPSRKLVITAVGAALAGAGPNALGRLPGGLGGGHGHRRGRGRRARRRWAAPSSLVVRIVTRRTRRPAARLRLLARWSRCWWRGRRASCCWPSGEPGAVRGRGGGGVRARLGLAGPVQPGRGATCTARRPRRPPASSQTGIYVGAAGGPGRLRPAVLADRLPAAWGVAGGLSLVAAAAVACAARRDRSRGLPRLVPRYPFR